MKAAGWPARALDDYAESIATQGEMVAEMNLTNRDRRIPDERQPWLRALFDEHARMLWVCWHVERKAATGEAMP